MSSSEDQPTHPEKSPEHVPTREEILLLIDRKGVGEGYTIFKEPSDEKGIYLLEAGKGVDEKGNPDGPLYIYQRKVRPPGETGTPYYCVLDLVQMTDGVVTNGERIAELNPATRTWEDR